MLLHKCGLEEMLYHEIRCAAVAVVSNRTGDSISGGDEDMEYFACYSTGGFLMLLDRWVSNGMKESPQVYAENVSSALLKFIGFSQKEG